MDTAIYNGDFLTAAGGIPVEYTGRDELLQQVYLRLKVKRGSLPYAPTLGSRLHTLTPGTTTQEAVLTFIAEAMEGCSNAEILSAEMTETGIAVEVRTPYGTGTITI